MCGCIIHNLHNCVNWYLACIRIPFKYWNRPSLLFAMYCCDIHANYKVFFFFNLVHASCMCGGLCITKEKFYTLTNLSANTHTTLLALAPLMSSAGLVITQTKKTGKNQETNNFATTSILQDATAMQ